MEHPQKTLTIGREDGERRIVLRTLSSDDDFEQCEALQRATWGDVFDELVPGGLMRICQKVGGIAAGAFDEGLLGFVFGLTGVRDRRLLHWSHMLAVDDGVRDLGLGRELKLYQRECLRALDIGLMLWTFDPLEARNAHLNLNRLGVRSTEYLRDVYGAGTSELHRGIGTDRLIASWDLDDPEVLRVAAGQRPPVAIPDDPGTVVNVSHGAPLEAGFELPESAAVRIEVPADIQAVKAADPALARRWRESTRHAFLGYLGRRWRVAGFYRDPVSFRCFYRMTP